MTSSNLDHLQKAPSPNTIALRGWGVHVGTSRGHNHSVYNETTGVFFPQTA